jgi:cysteine synthase
MRDDGERGAIVSLLCDRGERYAQTLFDSAWVCEHGIDPLPVLLQLRRRLDVA